MYTTMFERNMIKMNNESKELDILFYLQRRMDLSGTQRQKQSNLLKGLEGEQQLYDLLIKQLPSSFEILTDLLLTNNGLEFQIDILLIGDDTIYVLEVKNYAGNFIIQKDNWYVASTRNEIRNPLHQLKRMEILLRNMLQQGKLHFSIESYVVFVHPEFYLYQAPIDLALIFPTQVNRFIKKLQSPTFSVTQRHKNVTDYLKNQRLHRSTYERLPQYTYKNLRKGIVCQECVRFLEVFNQRFVICPSCKTKELIESAVERNVMEFMILFPSEKVTTNTIHDWCDIIKSKKTIRRLLKLFLEPVGVKNHRYYVMKEQDD